MAEARLRVERGVFRSPQTRRLREGRDFSGLAVLRTLSIYPDNSCSGSQSRPTPLPTPLFALNFRGNGSGRGWPLSVIGFENGFPGGSSSCPTCINYQL
jgi:hypothetical protein